MKKLYNALLLLMVCTLFTSCSSVKANNSSESSSNLQLANSQEIYNDDYISLSFVKTYESPDIKDTLFLDLRVTNNSSENITVYLQDAYVNDTMVQFGSGIPLDLLSDKERAHSFFCTFDSASISSIDEIKKIGFKAVVMNENTENIETTENIEITF